MSVLLAIMMVLALGTWIPLTQLTAGVEERVRILYVAVGNVVLAGVALVATGGGLAIGWRTFWLPLVGGLVWAAGYYCVLRATRLIGLARAAGTWTPLNIVSRSSGARCSSVSWTASRACVSSSWWSPSSPSWPGCC